MVLDFHFIIASSLVILALIPLYIYRKKIYTKFYKKGEIDTFFEDIKHYLFQNYPNIPFNFNILDKYKDEKDIRVQQTLIVEDLVNQFVSYEYEMQTQKDIPNELHWGGYKQNSILQKDNKLPSDWNQRKSAAWDRDHGKCNRCGTKVALSDANAMFVKQMRDGGGFNLENIVTLCNDCAKIIKSSDLGKTASDLPLLDRLMTKVDSY